MTWSTISHRNLLFVDIKVFDKTVERGQVNPVERTIQTIADICTQIRAKIGKGLTVRVQKDWAENLRPGQGDCFLHNPVLENISWMWEEPDRIIGSLYGTEEELEDFIPCMRAKR